MELMATLDEIARTHQVPVSQVAINWSTQKAFVSTALVGVRSVRHVAENLNTFTWQLSDAQMQQIDAEIARLGLDLSLIHIYTAIFGSFESSKKIRGR